MRKIQKIHFIGIGGSGMSGIAEVLHCMGYTVSGSDLSSNAAVQRLIGLGVTVFSDHSGDNIKNVDVVVVSTAINSDNPELSASMEKRIPVVPRAEMLAELMRYRHGIAVAGTHGKTTTTSIIATLLSTAGLDPTFVIGGILNSVNTNAKLGASRFFIAEADESDASFLHLLPQISVVTNIDRDHMSTYGHDFERLKSTFIQFLHNLPFYGLAILCADDAVIYGLLDQIHRPYVTYGLRQGVDYQAFNVSQTGLQMCFDVHRPAPHGELSVVFSSPGQHNVLNALAAIAVATEEGVSDEHIVAGLRAFSGVGRRLEVLGDFLIPASNSPTSCFTVIDDYGHHPNELKAVINTIRASWPTRRFVMVFQPHRYTRLRDLYDEFVVVLSEVDALILLDTYSAGEAPIKGATTADLCRSLRARAQIEPVRCRDTQQLPDVLAKILEADDILLLQGAGAIGQLAVELVNSLVPA